MASLTERLPGRGLSLAPTPFLGAVLLVPIVLAISRLLPDTGVGLAIRLAAAGAFVLLVPGALVLRAIGWPARLGVAIAGAFAWSLVVVGVALVLTVAAGGSLSLTVTLVAALSAGALVPALLQARVVVERSDLLAVAGLVAAGLALGAVVWWTQRQVGGDGLFHLARIRKLEELPSLDGLGSLNEFRDGGLHPGYALPVWHAALALIARLGDVDVAQVVLYLPALLVPLALVLAYAAGSALFGSWGAGVAAAGAQTALVAFPRGGVGVFAFLSLPATSSRVLLVPAVLVLAFAYVAEGQRRLLLSIGAAGLVLAIVHPTYALFVCLPLGGFLVARLVMAGREGLPDAKRLAFSLGAILLPTAIFFAWLLPVIRDTEAVRQTTVERAEDFEHYRGQVVGSVDSFHVGADAIARGGAAVVCSLLVLPLLVLAGRRRWASLALGGTLAVLGVMLLPFVFTHLSDVVSLSQSRRLIGFLPLMFVLAGAASLAGRLRWAGVVLAAALGVGLELAYPGEFTYRVGDGGPGWVVWVAVVGGLAALLAARFWPWEVADAPPRWVAFVGLALVVPMAVGGLREVGKEPIDRSRLSPGLVQALREEVPAGASVLADLEASYRIGAYAPVYVVANPPAHVARTKANQPYVRRAAIAAFFFGPTTTDAERWRIVERYDAEWVVVDRSRKRQPSSFLEFLGPPRFEDRDFALYEIPEELRP